MNDPDYLPAEIYNTHNQPVENRQGLSQFLDTRICDIRPVSTRQSQRIGYVGGQTFKVRLPDIGEIGLSKSEIDHAITYGISA